MGGTLVLEVKHTPESNIVYIIPEGGRYFPEWLIDGVQDCLEGRQKDREGDSRVI